VCWKGFTTVFTDQENWYFEFIIEVYWYEKQRKGTLLTNIQKTGR